MAELEEEGVSGAEEAVNGGVVGGGPEVGDELGEEGGPCLGEVVGTDDREGLGELGADATGNFEHEGDDEGFDLVLLGFGDGKVIGGGRPAGAKMVLEVDGGSEADLLVDRVGGDEVEDGEGEAG